MKLRGVGGMVSLIGMIRGFGGFRPESPNYVGSDCITDCMMAFNDGPLEMTSDGALRSRSLEGLARGTLTTALRSYVTRAQRGFEDSVLVAGTDKDLIEATAAHVLTEKYGQSFTSDFPTLLGQSFLALGLEAQRPKQEAGGLEGARITMSVSLYELGCAVNRLNKAGSGHGRPFVPDLSPAEVRAATEAAGLIAGRMLDALRSVLILSRSCRHRQRCPGPTRPVAGDVHAPRESIEPTIGDGSLCIGSPNDVAKASRWPARTRRKPREPSQRQSSPTLAGS